MELKVEERQSEVLPSNEQLNALMHNADPAQIAMGVIIFRL
jgi:hypothetical protein